MAGDPLRSCTEHQDTLEDTKPDLYQVLGNSLLSFIKFQRNKYWVFLLYSLFLQYLSSVLSVAYFSISSRNLFSSY